MVFNLRCRTCLCVETETTSLEKRISIDEHNTEICLLDIIKECASVEIPLGDSKPQGICQTCLQNAKISYTFRKKCEHSQVLLAQEFLKIDEIKLETNEDLLSSDDDVPLSQIKSFESISCQVCGKFYKSRKRLLTHLQSHKPLFNKEEPTDFTEKNEIVFEKANGSDNFDDNTEEYAFVKDELDSNVTPIPPVLISKKRLPCKKCDTVLDSHREWKEHMKTHCYSRKRDKKRSCPECLTTFTSQTLWLAHVRTAHASFTCRKCNVTSLRTIRQLKAHMVHFHADVGQPSTDRAHRVCDICGKTYVTMDAMFKHRRLRHGHAEQEALDIDVLGVSYCDYCPWKGGSSDLAKHKMAEHADMRSIECVECKRMFFTHQNLRLHMLVHTGEKKHMCEVCGAAFALQSNLIIHKRVHTGEKPYKCDQCDKAFTQHSSLHVHKFTHTVEPTFKCDECGATFYRKDSYRYHMKKHRSEDEWDKCEICDKKFKSRKLLRNHRVVHTGERNHQCTVCAKSFGRRSSLRTHMRIHTGEKPHVCLVCERGFLQKHVLRTHMKTHGNKQ